MGSTNRLGGSLSGIVMMHNLRQQTKMMRQQQTETNYDIFVRGWNDGQRALIEALKTGQLRIEDL